MKIGVWHDAAFEKSFLEKLGGKALGFDHPSALGTNIASAVQQLRFSLTEGELERYREVGTLVSLSIEEAAASIKPGMSEFEVIARVSEITTSRGLALYSAQCAADERITSFRHAIPTDKRIKTRVQLGGNFGKYGLVACLTRYVNFAPVSEALRKQFRANQEIDISFMKNSIPGKSYQYAFLAGKKAYEDRGYGAEFDKHHQGGPLGYAARDYRIDFSHTGIIQENQAFCWNPSITGTKSEDTIVAKKNGFEFITKPLVFPKAEIHVDGETYIRADILER
jgi:Xaa-Pro aminopeptidase